MESLGDISSTSVLVAVLASLLRAEDERAQLYQRYTLLTCLRQLHRLLFSAGTLPFPHSLAWFAHSFRLFWSNLDRPTSSLGSDHSVAENSRERVLYKYVNAGCDTVLVTTFLSSSILFSCACNMRCQIILRALESRSGSPANIGGRRPL